MDKFEHGGSGWSLVGYVSMYGGCSDSSSDRVVVGVVAVIVLCTQYFLTPSPQTSEVICVRCAGIDVGGENRGAGFQS